LSFGKFHYIHYHDLKNNAYIGENMFYVRMILLMSIFFSTPSAFAENKSPKVAVIGAGLAGLTAAYRLQNEGVDVDLYEARNRVGGRVFSVYIDGNIVELGAQNITDGGEAINLMRLIEEFGLEHNESRVTLDLSYFNGEELIPLNELTKNVQMDPLALRAQINELIATSHSMKDILDGMFDESDPLYNILAVRLAAYEGATIEKLSTFYAETLFHMLLGGICAVHQGQGDEESFLDLITIKGGNGLLTEKMAATLGNRLHVNMPLKGVSKGGDGSFALTFDDGQTASADIVILAIPCSVYENIVFDGVIPPDRLEAIKSVQYGTNAKILVPFPHKPLRRKGLVQDQIVSFFDFGRNNLTVYYTGDTSLFSSDTIENSYLQARPMLESAFGDDCPAFTAPVYAEDKAFASYNAPVGYSWPNDPYVKGSYSYISPGQETLLTAMGEENGEQFKTLFAPIDGNLYFAGEHASILIDVPGTMEAACESGERVARMILGAYFE
jgi:monoamine oxidase